MSLKTDKINQRIQDIQQFAAVRSERSSVFSAVYNELEKTSELLNEGKLVLHIVSEDPTLAVALQNLYKAHKTLPDLYKFQITALPSKPQIGEFDVLCIVVDAGQILPDTIKRVLEKASQIPMLKLLMVIDMLSSDPDNQRRVQTAISEVDSWLSNQNPIAPHEITALLLLPFYPDSLREKVEVNFQKDLDKFCLSLEVLVKGKVEDILIKQATAQLLAQLAQIKTVFNQEEAELKVRLQEEERKLQGTGGIGGLKKDIEKAFKKADMDRADFFKRAKEKSSSIKRILSNESDTRSLKYEIKQLADDLRVDSKNKGKYTTVSLQLPDGRSCHEMLISHCRNSLSEFANDTWKRLCNSSNEGGMVNLAQRMSQTLSIVPSLYLPKPLFQPDQTFDIQRYFQSTSKTEFDWKSRYKRESFGSFLIKEIRSNIMIATSFFMLFAGTATVLTSSSVDKTPPTGIFDLKIAKAGLTAFILPFIVGITYSTYRQNVSEKQEDASEKLRSIGCKHYQAIAIDYVDNVVDFTNKKLDAEEQKIRDILEEAREKFITYTGEAENRIINYKAQLSNLNTEKTKLDSFERL
ncbi:MAG: hypothetical protein KME45_33035 [Stenomitos rutilans HA7619-LM2]|jgi:hypothetical protein|nr:hypothetical protein [Stenomitos rutilans HA7619-LM2]